MDKLNINKLDKSYTIFGNKGNVWSDKCHVMKNGQNLCGTPALSTNHAKLNNVQTIGCKDCLKELRATQ